MKIVFRILIRVDQVKVELECRSCEQDLNEMVTKASISLHLPPGM